MADNLTTTTEVDPGLEVYYDRTLLETAYPNYVHTKFAQRRPVPKKSGKTIKFRRYSRLSVATTPLTEGITPNGQKLAKTDLLATVSQYGDYVHITDVVDLTVEDAVLTEAMEKLSDQMHATNDVICRDVLASSATTLTCSNGSPTATLLNKTDIDAAVQTLLGGNAKFMTKLIKAGVGQGTAPIRPSFWGIIDSDLIDDLEAVSGYKNTSQYPAQSHIDAAEWGSTGNVRWLWTTEGYVSGSNYSCPIIAQNAYGMVDIEGGNAKSIIKAFGSGGTSDPLNQRATAGWKEWEVFRILNDAFLIILICTNG
jgi:N4-gp56 family major capsid protein